MFLVGFSVIHKVRGLLTDRKNSCLLRWFEISLCVGGTYRLGWSEGSGPIQRCGTLIAWNRTPGILEMNSWPFSLVWLVMVKADWHWGGNAGGLQTNSGLYCAWMTHPGPVQITRVSWSFSEKNSSIVHCRAGERSLGIIGVGVVNI